MKLVTTEFKSGGLHEKHLVAFRAFFELVRNVWPLITSLLDYY